MKRKQHKARIKRRMAKRRELIIQQAKDAAYPDEVKVITMATDMSEDHITTSYVAWTADEKAYIFREHRQELRA